MKRLSLLLVFALCLPLSARADDASHRAKAAELLTLMHTQDMVKRLTDTLKKQVSGPGRKGDRRQSHAPGEQRQGSRRL